MGRVRQVKKKSFFRPIEFPLTLGRDFAGEVVAKGADVDSEHLAVGDAVLGVVAPFQHGCHAQFVTVPVTQVMVGCHSLVLDKYCIFVIHFNNCTILL